MDKLGGRKFVFAVAVVIIASGFVFAKVLPIEKWVEFVEVVGASYVLGNIASKFVAK